jgi:outer membrane protein assembly factor BamB
MPQGQGPNGRPQQQEEEDTSYLLDVYRWNVACIDLATGKEIWKKTAKEGAPRIKSHDGNGYASETPVTDGQRVYVYFGMTGLFCYDLNGTLLWQKDMGAFKSLNGWGTGASPVVYNGVVYVQIDNEVNSFLVALDAVTGNEKWRVSREETTSYSTPFIWKNKLRTELITCALTVRSYDPDNGKLLWEMKLPGERSIPSPSAMEDMLFVGCPGGNKTKASLYAVKPGATGDISLMDGTSSNEFITWSIQDAPTGNPSPLLYNGYLYIVSSRGGEFSCIDASSGALVYKKKIDGVQACWSSPWVVNGIINFYDERGITRQVKAGPQFELLPDQNKLSDKFWASIAVQDDKYVFKGVKKLYCICLH